MAPSSVRLESTFCRNFTCCGRELEDLHDLLQHYEECHVRFEDDISLTDETDEEPEDSTSLEAPNGDMSTAEIKRMRHTSAPGANTLVAPASEDLDSPSAFDTAVMSSPSVAGRKRMVPVGAFGTSATQSLHRAMVEGGVGRRQLGSIYSAGSPFSTPGTSRAGTPSLDGENDTFFGSGTQPSIFSNLSLRTPAEEQQLPSCAPPNLFFPSSISAQARTIKRERVGATPSPGAQTPVGNPASPTVSVETPQAEHRPYKCPAPGCDKAYKQMNGLKYHRLHGHCNQNLRNTSTDLVSGKVPDCPSDSREKEVGTVHPDLRAFGINATDSVEESSDSQSPSSKPALAIQPEKAYVCQVGNCDKRYKNLNGLRYHYLHSGSHGLLGLQLLHANGGGASAKADGSGRPPVSTDTLSREQIVQAAAAAQALLNQQMQAQSAKTSSASAIPQVSSAAFLAAAACNGTLAANAGQLVNE